MQNQLMKRAGRAFQQERDERAGWKVAVYSNVGKSGKADLSLRVSSLLSVTSQWTKQAPTHQPPMYVRCFPTGGYRDKQFLFPFYIQLSSQMTVVQPDGPINHMSCQRCAGEDLSCFTSCIGLNSITSRVTWKKTHVDNLRHLLITLDSNFSFLKRNHLDILPQTGVLFLATLSFSKVTDSPHAKVLVLTYVWLKMPAVGKQP